MPRRTYNPKRGRRRPTTPDPDYLTYLAQELARRAQWRNEKAAERNAR